MQHLERICAREPHEDDRCRDFSLGDIERFSKTVSFSPATYHWGGIVDFVCFERQLVIEVDGGYHSEPHQQEEDLSRTESLGRMGFDVIRFTNEQVIENQQEVIREIKEILYNE